MGWTVYNSDGKILQSAELGDNAVTSAKIADGAIVNADINASAVIAYSKLAALADGNILVGNGSALCNIFPSELYTVQPILSYLQAVYVIRNRCAICTSNTVKNISCI